MRVPTDNSLFDYLANYNHLPSNLYKVLFCKTVVEVASGPAELCADDVWYLDFESEAWTVAEGEKKISCSLASLGRQCIELAALIVVPKWQDQAVEQ